MQNQLIEIYENDLRSNSDSLVKIISNRLSTAENAMHNIIGTYGTHTTADFISVINRSNYTNSMGKLSYYPNYELEKMIQNTTKTQQEIEPITENFQEGDILDPEILNSLATLKTGNKLYTFNAGSDGFYLRIVMPVFFKNKFSGILVNGYNPYRYNSIISISTYSNQDSVMLLDKNTGFCTLDQNGNTNVNYFDYLNTVNFISGSLETLKNTFIADSYGLVRFIDPTNQIEYYMTYDDLGIANLVVCNLIPYSYVEAQASKINASSDDLILVIFSVVFIMIVLIFVVDRKSTRLNSSHP